LANSSSQSSDPTAPRLLLHEDRVWRVREIDAHFVPGAPSASSLLYESDLGIRRLWFFPVNWKRLDDDALWRLSETSPALSSRAGVWKTQLQTAFLTSALAEREAQATVELARAVVAANRRLRAERRVLIEACRASRRAVQDTVRRYAREMSDAGSSERDVVSQVAEPLGTFAFVLEDEARVERLRRDVARWCALEFRAA
jgi:hypothetical protein